MTTRERHFPDKHDYLEHSAILPFSGTTFFSEINRFIILVCVLLSLLQRALEGSETELRDSEFDQVLDNPFTMALDMTQPWFGLKFFDFSGD